MFRKIGRSQEFPPCLDGHYNSQKSSSIPLGVWNDEGVGWWHKSEYLQSKYLKCKRFAENMNFLITQFLFQISANDWLQYCQLWKLLKHWQLKDLATLGSSYVMKFDRVVLIEICFKCICSVLSYENSQNVRFRLHQVTKYTLKHPELKFYQYNYKAQTILSSEIATSHSIEIHNNHSTIQVTYYWNSVLPLSGKMLPINSAQDLQSARKIIYLSISTGYF